MSWNSLIDLLFLGLLTNGVTGSFLYLIWRGTVRVLGEKLDVQASYRILHIVALFFACPIFGILEVLEASCYSFGNSMLDPLGSGLHMIWFIFVTLWLSGIVLLMLHYYRIGKQVRELIVKGSMSANLQWQKSVQEAKEQLGCRTSIHCRERYGDTTPFVIGVRHATIYFPVGSFTPEQMHVMAIHEVNHVKSKDLFWKQLVEIVKILYWPLIPVWFMRRAIDDWSEYCCDFLSCKALGNYGEYVDVLTDLIFRRVQWYCPAWLSTFHNEYSELQLRVRKLVNQKKLDSDRMRFVLIAASLFCILGSGSVLAATRSMTLEYRDAYWNDLVKTLDSSEEEVVYPPAGEVITGEPDLFGLEQIPESEWLDGRIEDYDVAMDPQCMFFDLVLEPGESAISAPLENDPPGDIYISCSLDQEGYPYVMGILDPEGVCRYILAGDEANRANTFTCELPGEYRFFLSNCGEEELAVFGMASMLYTVTE